MRIALSDLAEGRTYRYQATFTDEDTADLLEGTLAEPMQVHVSHTTVEGVTYLRVSTQGKVHARCDLCGAPCVADCACQIDEELTTDSECYDPTADEYVLDGIIDEAVVMSEPRKVLCRPDCKGLCPTCGKNLNDGKCDCQQNKPQVGENNPFGMLKDIFPTGGANNGSTKM